MCTVDGTAQADDLTGTDGNDVICALDGNDHVDTCIHGADGAMLRLCEL